MYRIGENYAVILKGNITFTGKILEEDAMQIKIHTIKDEKIIIGKEEILRSFEKTDEEMEKLIKKVHGGD